MVAEAIAKPLANIDSITMYGEGNTAKMTEDITKSFKQTIDGIGDSLGINLSNVVGSFAGTKLAGSSLFNTPAPAAVTPVATTETAPAPAAPETKVSVDDALGNIADNLNANPNPVQNPTVEGTLTTTDDETDNEETDD